MNDKEFLKWLYLRLAKMHRESPNIDYMRKLASIIVAMPEDQYTPNTGPSFPEIFYQ